MAAVSQQVLPALYAAVEFFFEDEEDAYMLHSRLKLINSSIYAQFFQREHVPRITGFAENVVPSFTCADFRYHFRIRSEMYEEILRIIGPTLIPKRNGGGVDQIDPAKQLLIFLWYMGNQESMRELSFIFGISISTIHCIISRINETIRENLGNVIQWPDAQAQHEIAREFQLKCGLPDIMGAIDGTHIRLASAPGGDEDYINRKSFPSMQLQIVTDNSLLIRDIYTGWPGCTHDARVFRNSSIIQRCEQGNSLAPNKYIIGDSAYPLKTWLITPFRDNGHLNRRQRRFNSALSCARQDVERCIGHLKGRFRRLREITVHKPEDIVATIASGCILHDMCILSEDNIEDFIEPDNGGHPNNFPRVFRDGGDGAQKRIQLMQTLP